LRRHGATFAHPNKGVVTNPHLGPNVLGGAYIYPGHPKFGHVELGAGVAKNTEKAVRLAQRTGNWEPAHNPLVTMVHEETHFAASADPRSYFGRPEHMWIEEATTELAAQRLTSQWIGTQQLTIGPQGLTRAVAYKGTIHATLDIVSNVLGVAKAAALDIVTDAGLAMRRPGSQTRTYLQAFLDGLPASVTQAQKTEMSRQITSAAAARVPTGGTQPVLDAKGVSTRSWSAVLGTMLARGEYPTLKQVDEAVKLSGAKTATTGEVYPFAMAGLYEPIVGALTKYGAKIIDDGNVYR
jgi:hypothetical protein